MTAGYGLAPGQNTNPITNGTPQYGNSPLFPIQRIGYLANTQAGAPGEGSKLLFMYNPNDIQVSFQFDTSQYPPNFLASGNTGSNMSVATAGVTNQTVSWTLYFDRTYDMMDGADPGGSRGVLKDIGALYSVLGTFATGNSALGIPILTLCEVVFGQTNDGQIWGFTGLISAVNIDYGIFKYNMIPSKCEVQLSMNCVYVPPQLPQTPTGAAAAVPTVASVLTNPASAFSNPISTILYNPDSAFPR